MGILDIIIIAILALVGLIGLFKGFMRTGLSFIFDLLTLGVAGGAAFGTTLIGLVNLSDQENLVKNIIIMAVAFIVGLIIGLIIFGSLKRLCLKARKHNGFRIFDGIIGMLFSMAIWVAVFCALFSVVKTLENSKYQKYPDYILTENTLVASVIYRNNPLDDIIGGALDGAGVQIADYLDMIMP